MKKYLFILLAVGAMMLSSCKKDGNIQMDAAVQHIPSDATQVTVVRIPQLMKKVDFNTLRDSEQYQQMIKEAASQDPLISTILYEPSESGIRMDQNAYFVSDINPTNINEMVNGLMVNLADVAKFEALVQSSPISINAKKMSGYQYTSNSEGFMAWNDEIAFMGQSSGDNLETSLDRIFNLGDGGSVLASPNYEKVGSSNKDISFMVSTDAVAENPQLAFGSMIMGWSKDDLLGNYINGEMNFEDKKMVVNADFLLKKILMTDLGMPFKSNISTDFSPYIPKENLTGVFTFGLDTKGLLQILKEKNALGMLNQQAGLDRMGISIEELANAIDGDMLLAMQKEGSEGKPAGIFSMSVNEKEFQVFLDKLAETGMISGSAGVYTVNDEKMAESFDEGLGGTGNVNKPSLIMKDGKIFISADPVLIAGIKNGGLAKGDRIDKGLYKEISSGFLGGKGFPKELEEMSPEIADADIESFVYSVKDGNIHLEITSNKAGNFLKNMVENAQK